MRKLSLGLLVVLFSGVFAMLLILPYDLANFYNNANFYWLYIIHGLGVAWLLGHVLDE